MEENKSKLILGLDVSTTTIGCTLMQVDGNKREIIKATAVSPKINKNIKGVEALFLKKKIFENEFLKQYVDFQIDEVIIEEPLARSNNVGTVLILARFNILIAESVYDLLKIVPKFISVYDARSNAFPELVGIRTINKKGEPVSLAKQKASKPALFSAYSPDIDKKQIILEKVLELYPDLVFTYDKKGNLDKSNFDVTDSITVVIGWLNEQENLKLL